MLKIRHNQTKKQIHQIQWTNYLFLFCLIVSFIFVLVAVLYSGKVNDEFANVVIYSQTNVYYFNNALQMVLYTFNPFAITATIFISILTLLLLYEWFSKIITSLYLIKLYGLRILIDNPYLNQFLCFMIIFYGVFWATICPNFYDVNSSFTFYWFSGNIAHINAGGIIYVIFFILFNLYIGAITLIRANSSLKYRILHGKLAMKKVVIFGITGSIGTQCLQVISSMHESIAVVGASFGKNAKLMQEIINNNPTIASVYSPLDSSLNTVDSYEQLIKKEHPDLIINALGGLAGIPISFMAINNNIELLLANKESLVCAGNLLMQRVKETNGKIWPIDSEHACLKALVDKYEPQNISKMYITCSGGPFYNVPNDQLSDVTVQEACNHPTWKMGQKISIDCATLMNKAFEIIEAYWLFDHAKVTAVYHPQSIVHAFATLNNNATVMYEALPSMLLPIQLALNQFNVNNALIKALDFNDLTLTFGKIDENKWPALKLTKLFFDGYADTTFGLIITALDEIAVNKFINGTLPFNQIVPFIFSNYNNFKITPLTDYSQIETILQQIKETFNND